MNDSKPDATKQNAEQTEATFSLRTALADAIKYGRLGEDEIAAVTAFDVEIVKLRGLLNHVGATVFGGAGARRVCDGPGSYAPECGPTYDEIFAAHKALEAITDAL